MLRLKGRSACSCLPYLNSRYVSLACNCFAHFCYIFNDAYFKCNKSKMLNGVSHIYVMRDLPENSNYASNVRQSRECWIVNVLDCPCQS